MSWRFTLASALVLTFAAVAPAVMIMPVGDSITEGVGSTNDDGYRGYLQNLLVADGLIVDYLGTYQDGPATTPAGPGATPGGLAFDRDNQAYPGLGVNAIRTNLSSSGDDPFGANNLQPDIILIMAGTNDALSDTPTVTRNRLRNMINDIYVAVPGVDIVVSTLIPILNDPAKQTWVDQYNALILDLFNDPNLSITNGGTLTLLDMQAAAGLVTSTGLGGDYDDDLHPNDAGYAKMALAWHGALQSIGVPAPGTLTLLAAGAAMVLPRRRRAR